MFSSEMSPLIVLIICAMATSSWAKGYLVETKNSPTGSQGLFFHMSECFIKLITNNNITTVCSKLGIVKQKGTYVYHYLLTYRLKVTFVIC